MKDVIMDVMGVIFLVCGFLALYGGLRSGDLWSVATACALFLSAAVLLGGFDEDGEGDDFPEGP